jgi:hypothetical protein
LITALRAQLGSGEPPDAAALASCDWGEVCTLARHHALTPIVYKAIEGCGALVAAEALQQTRLAYHANALRNEGLQRFVAETGTALAGEGIPVLLLKGTSLLRTLYGDIGLRHLGDVDLLVDEHDVARAESLLARRGFRSSGPPPKVHWPTCDFHLVYRCAGVASIPVELHWRLFEDFLPYLFDLQEVRTRVVPAPGLPEGIFTMAPEHELAYLCMHLERHAVTYVSLVGRDDWFDLVVLPQGKGRLIWLYDVALYVQRRAAAIDWDRFVRDARRWGIGGRVATVLELCRRVFSVAPPGDVMNALGCESPGLLERSVHRALIAAYRAGERERHGAPRSRVLRWLGPVANRAIGWGHMWRSVFPPASYLALRSPRDGSHLRLRVRHLRKMAPEVWGAIRRKLGRPQRLQPS